MQMIKYIGVYMNLRILEGLYYLVTIIVSVGFLRNLFNTLAISSSLEIIFCSKPQRFVLKIWFFIRYFFLYTCACILVIYGAISNKFGFSVIDFSTYFLIIYFCDEAHFSLFKNSALLKLYFNLSKKEKGLKELLFILLSILLTILTYYIGEIIDKKYLFIFQLISLFAFFVFCNKERNIKINGKNFKFDFISITVFSTPLFIKILLFFNENSVLYSKLSQINKIELSDIANYVDKVYNNRDSLNIIIAILLLSILVAIFCVKRDINLSAYLIYKNRTWEIINITVDKYAICYCDNYILTIKIDTIKDNYFCEHNEGCFYFRVKDDLKEIDITDNIIKNKPKAF